MAEFGKINVGGSTTGIGANFSAGSKYVLGVNALVDEIHFYCGTYAYGAGDTKGAIYTDNAGAPNVLMGETDTVAALNLNAWNILPFNPDINLTAGTYWIVYWSEQNPQICYDAGAANQYYQTQSGNAMNGFPSPFSWAISYLARELSIHAQYTATGGAVSIPVAMHHYGHHISKIIRG